MLSINFKSIWEKLKGYLIPYSSVLGIDIGTTTIKVVELNKSDSVLSLKNYGILENFGHLERENAAIQTSGLKIVDEMTASLLKELLVKMGPTVKEAVFSLPAFSSFVTVMDLPNVSEKEFNQVIPYEARQYVPIPLSEVVLDWQVLNPLPSSLSGRAQVLLIAVSQDVVNKYYRIAELAGLRLKALELESVSTARALIGNDSTTTAIIDIGSRATSISMVDEKDVRLTHDIDMAGNDLTLAIARGMNISPIKAEEIKKNYGILITAEQQYLPGLLTPLLDFIISEIKKLSSRYTDKTRREVKKAILCGGGALPPGIKDYFQKELGMPVELGNPFARVSYAPDLEPVLKEIKAQFSPAVGAGLKVLK
ncbi:MAG: type IV pilus assembly protein PilM [Patescibacteria group bacterium]